MTNERADVERGWLSLSHKNQPQWNALGAASLIFVSGGMSIAWGAGFAEHSDHLTSYTIHLQVSWYFAALLGTAIGAILTPRTRHRPIYIVGAGLVLTCGILYLAVPTQHEAIIAARYLDGMANGLVLVPALSSAGELSVPGVRGLLCVTIEQLSCNIGILLQMCYTALWFTNWNEYLVADQVHGVLSIMYGVTALGLALTLSVESPVQVLLRSDDLQAVQALRHLQRPYMVTSETFDLLDDLKRYVESNRELSRPQRLKHSLMATVKLSVYRVLNALSLTMVMWSALHETARELTPEFHTWPFLVFGSLRLCGSLVALFLMDSWGRKKPTLFGVLATGALAIVFATQFDKYSFALERHLVSSISMLFGFQFFAGVAHAACSVYPTEAFPLADKPLNIGFIYSAELVTRMIFCSYKSTEISIVMYFYVIGGISMVFFLLGIFLLPETKLLTLIEAQEKFSKFYNNDF